MLYSREEIYEAAYKAYRASACSDPEYHRAKAEQFVLRCMRLLGIPEWDEGCSSEDQIDEDTLEEICFAALDEDCTAVFWTTLAEIEVRGDGIRCVGETEDGDF